MSELFLVTVTNTPFDEENKFKGVHSDGRCSVRLTFCHEQPMFNFCLWCISNGMSTRIDKIKEPIEIPKVEAELGTELLTRFHEDLEK